MSETTPITTAREALELAANRFDRVVLDQEFGSERRYVVSEWADEARAAAAALSVQPAREAQPYIENIKAWIDAEAADGQDTIVMSANYAQELIDLLSALSAAPAPAETGWQPIETAPRDGSYVLGFGPHKTRGSYVDAIHYYRDRFTIEWMEDYGAPTHWMPLPPAPSTGEG